MLKTNKTLRRLQIASNDIQASGIKVGEISTSQLS